MHMFRICFIYVKYIYWPYFGRIIVKWPYKGVSMSVISYPIPAYSNVPIQPQFYQPRFWFISTITRGIQTTVTTTVTQDFVVGQLVRFIIPQPFGIRQLNEQQGYVIQILSPTQFVVDIDSRFMDAFTSSSSTTQPQVIPVGDVGNGQINSQGRINNGTYIPGSFINISPN